MRLTRADPPSENETDAARQLDECQNLTLSRIFAMFLYELIGADPWRHETSLSPITMMI